MRVKPRWWVARGESVVASLGIVLGVVIVGVLAASSWWTLRTYRTSLERGREQELRTAALYLGVHVMDLLGDGKQSAVANALEAARQRDELEACRVVLGDGKTIGDAKNEKPPKLVVRTPDKGEEAAPERVTLERTGDVLKATSSFTAKGHGKCTLEMTAEVRYPVLADKDVQLGIGATGVLGMGGLLLTYKLMRRRLRGLSAIAEALRCVPRLEARSDARALRVSERFGPEARAWNMLLDQRDAMREKAMLEDAAEKLQSRGGAGAGGDLGVACDALWAGLVVLDGAGKVRYANGAAGVLLRRKREELTGALLSTVIEDGRAAEAILAVASGKSRQRTSIELAVGGKAEGGKEPGSELKVGASDRTMLRLTSRPLRKEDGTAADGPTALVLIEDVTQSRVADESRNAFVAQATHELRTPLTNIRLYVETMVDEGENDAAVRSKCLNVISGEVKRLERIVGDMLSVAEIEAGSLKLNNGEIRLDALFEELEADFKAQAEDKEIKLVFDLPPKYPLMRGDRDKLLLALNNLIGNGLKYTPAGGAVSVKVMANAERELVVEVADNGIGISQEEQELIFDRFYRAKDRRIAGITGSGIGLALARQVVRLHHGEITVKSQLDKGSTFTLTVPLGAGKTQAMAA